MLPDGYFNFFCEINCQIKILLQILSHKKAQGRLELKIQYVEPHFMEVGSNLQDAFSLKQIHDELLLKFKVWKISQSINELFNWNKKSYSLNTIKLLRDCLLMDKFMKPRVL